MYETQPAFRRAVDQCASVPDRSEFALFALEYALAELWRSWDIQPMVCLGDGVGACVAECVSGVLSLEDGLRNCAIATADTKESLAARIRSLHEQGCNVFVEIGPRPMLIDVGRLAVTDPGVLWLPSLDPTRSEWQQMLESLAALYERGAMVDWSGFDREYRRCKVALPTYPFQRQRYWLQPREDVPPELVTDLLYRLEWRPKPLESRAAPAHSDNWLIVEPRRELGDDLSQRLSKYGQRAMVAGEFHLPPESPYRGVVYLCSVSEESYTPGEAEAQSIGLLHLVQALSRSGSAARLWLVTRGSQAVTGAETIHAAQAPLWGLARTVRLEHPEFQCVSVDLAPETENLDQLVAEMLSPGESQIAYRNETRYVARLVRDHGKPELPSPRIREDGCYLVTGGLGALGLDVARYLVDQGARQLVLAGRSGRGGDSAVEELRASGVSVQLVQADVARTDDVARLITTCQALGPLRGIVHAAGVLDDGILENQTAVRFARVTAPKIRGAWALHVQTQSLPLDFFVCFSSMAALLGSPGQGNYAAANAFLDALAHHSRARGLPGLSINWGPWADVGMAANLHSRLQAHGEGMIDPALGVHMFTRALARGPAQIGVMRVDWTQYAATYPAPEFLEMLLDQSEASRPGAGPGPALIERLRAAPVDRRQELLEEFVQSQVAIVLGHPTHAVSRTRGFADLGMDSLASIELRTHLEQALDCRLPTTLAFDYPNVEALSEHLVEQVIPIRFHDNTAARRADPSGVSSLDHLTRDDIAALLASELSTLEEGKNR
jgi:acyl transferase domain-containing protein/acyl carrier protein